MWPQPEGFRADALAAIWQWWSSARPKSPQLKPWQATSDVAYDPEWSAAKKTLYSMLAPRR